MELDVLTGNVEHYTPPADHLKPYKHFNCSQPDCNNTFTNQANYDMHLEKHHRLFLSHRSSFNMRLYHCPELNCIYQFGKEKGKHFKNMKYLRQHYQKVHLSKDFVCDDCGKAFSLESQLKKHKRDVCGKKFACRECGWPYESLEALLTHGKRKGHNVKDVIMITKMDRVKVQKDVQVDNKITNNKLERKGCEETKSKLLIDNDMNVIIHSPEQNVGSSHTSAGVQTDCFVQLTDDATNQELSNALDEIHSFLRDIETQTEPFLSSANENQNYLDQMLAQSSHMYTQTCDDFLSELGLADIQTQTHWPSPPRHVDDKLQFTSTATSTNCIHDELLVSTETQTSFTQCLLNSCNDTDSNPTVSFGSLYHTSSQHTQTCEPLLESFDFGGQASDLIDGGFQSTYTQT
ncbi:uncharacterized protein LOC142234354 [Haematobia irritans]|uniref:uncharacterized protein LOC142234354 n=1 Tax=Haematobia irritans TaxID=7368 RepID=UPI003F4FA9B0